MEQVPFGGWLQSPFGVKAEQTNSFCEHFNKHLWELGCHLGAKTEKKHCSNVNPKSVQVPGI